jgi:hypothetical protein
MTPGPFADPVLLDLLDHIDAGDATTGNTLIVLHVVGTPIKGHMVSATDYHKGIRTATGLALAEPEPLAEPRCVHIHDGDSWFRVPTQNVSAWGIHTPSRGLADFARP